MKVCTEASSCVCVCVRICCGEMGVCELALTIEYTSQYQVQYSNHKPPVILLPLRSMFMKSQLVTRGSTYTALLLPAEIKQTGSDTPSNGSYLLPSHRTLRTFRICAYTLATGDLYSVTVRLPAMFSKFRFTCIYTQSELRDKASHSYPRSIFYHASQTHG